MQKKYVVRLSDEEREELQSAVRKLKAPNRLAAVVLALRTGEISQL